MARRALLQWIVQTHKPNLVCIHQNGSTESYEWVIEDLKPLINVHWIHTPETLRQHDWYLKPLEWLLDQGCGAFFWADHDDIFYTNHVAACLRELDFCDFTVSDQCGVLRVKDLDYRYAKPVKFTSHAPGGMSSSMAFNRNFAESLKEDLREDKKYHYADNVVAFITKLKHSKYISNRQTTAYVSHLGANSSSSWIDF